MRMLVLLLLLLPALSVAKSSTFLSIKSNEVNARVGPGKEFPVRWVYRRAGLPVEVIETHKDWCKLRDPDGDEGWIYAPLLSAKRQFYVREILVALKSHPDTSAPDVAHLQQGVIGRVEACKAEWWKQGVTPVGSIDI